MASQDTTMELFRDELGHATLLSVGHRSELEDYHDRKLTLHRHATRVEMVAGENIRHRRDLSRLLRGTLRPRPSPDPSGAVSERSDD
jgi:putative ATP-binding cassette transporter